MTQRAAKRIVYELLVSKVEYDSTGMEQAGTR